MPYLYTTATKSEVLITLIDYLDDEGMKQMRKRTTEYDQKFGTRIKRDLNLPFVPKSYILANCVPDEEVSEMIEKLITNNHRVAVENGLGRIKERKVI